MMPSFDLSRTDLFCFWAGDPHCNCSGCCGCGLCTDALHLLKGRSDEQGSKVSQNHFILTCWSVAGRLPFAVRTWVKLGTASRHCPVASSLRGSGHVGSSGSSDIRKPCTRQHAHHRGGRRHRQRRRHALRGSGAAQQARRTSGSSASGRSTLRVCAGPFTSPGFCGLCRFVAPNASSLMSLFTPLSRSRLWR